MVFSHVAVPSCGTTCTTGTSVGYCILFRQHAHLFETVLQYDVSSEDIVILLEHGLHVSAEFLHIFGEVGIDIILASTYTVVVLYESATCRFLHHVEHLFAVSHAIDECSESAEVLSAAAIEEEVRVETLQFVHHHTNILDAVREFNAHGLLDDSAQSVSVHHGREVVESVCESERLRISIFLAHLLYTAVNISAVRIDASYGLTVEHRLQSEHTVCSRVLRSDIDYILIVAEEFAAMSLQVSVLVERVRASAVGFRVVIQGEGFILRHLVVLSEWEALEIASEVKSAHVWVSREDDAVEVIHLPFEQFSCFPEVADSGQPRFLPVGVDRLHRNALMSISIFEYINTSESLFSEVFSDDSDEEVEMLFVQCGHGISQLCRTVNFAI